MKRIMFAAAGLLFSFFAKAQTSATTTASVSAEIIHPVGTGIDGAVSSTINWPGKINVFKEKDRKLIMDSLDPSQLRIINNGNVFDLSIELDSIPSKKERQEKACRVTVHFN